MILHIGNGKTVRRRDIIGIFDMDNVTVTAAGRAFLSRAQKEGRVSAADYDIPRSFLLCDGERSNENEPPLLKGGGPRSGGGIHPPSDRVILSHISSLSLAARAEDEAWEEA